MLHTDPIAYYAARAATYETIYDRPERQEEQALLQGKVAALMEGHDVLEIACGTGYWTRQLAAVANSVTALDATPAMLALAQERQQLLAEPGNVTFVEGDAYDLPPQSLQQSPGACFAAFWWSHVPRQNQAAWLNGLQKKLGKDTLLVLIDNSYLEGSSTPIAHTDAHGNTYQIRALEGERYDILKNFPTDSTLRKRFGDHAREIRMTRLEHFWMLTCRLK